MNKIEGWVKGIDVLYLCKKKKKYAVKEESEEEE